MVKKVLAAALAGLSAVLVALKIKEQRAEQEQQKKAGKGKLEERLQAKRIKRERELREQERQQLGPEPGQRPRPSLLQASWQPSFSSLVLL